MNMIDRIFCGHCRFKANVDKSEGKIIRLSCATCKISVEGKDEVKRMLEEMLREWKSASRDAALEKAPWITIEIDGIESEIGPVEGEPRMKTISSKCNFYIELT